MDKRNYFRSMRAIERYQRSFGKNMMLGGIIFIPFYALLPLILQFVCYGIIEPPDSHFADLSKRIYFVENDTLKDKYSITIRQNDISLTLIGSSYVYQNSVSQSSWILFGVKCKYKKANETLKIYPDSIRVILSNEPMLINEVKYLESGNGKYNIMVKAICGQTMDCSSANQSRIKAAPEIIIDLSRFLTKDGQRIEIGQIAAFARKPQQ